MHVLLHLQPLPVRHLLAMSHLHACACALCMLHCMPYTMHLNVCQSATPIAVLFLCCSVPNITAYHGAFQTRDEICIVMEYCPRGDLLERLLAEGRAFDELRVAEVSAALLSTLQVRPGLCSYIATLSKGGIAHHIVTAPASYPSLIEPINAPNVRTTIALLLHVQRMHSLAVIHRDVKLENIFIGGAGELKLGDFGLTMSMKQEAAISPVGTVEYMSPEVSFPFEPTRSERRQLHQSPEKTSEPEAWSCKVHSRGPPDQTSGLSGMVAMSEFVQT